MQERIQRRLAREKNLADRARLAMQLRDEHSQDASEAATQLALTVAKMHHESRLSFSQIAGELGISRSRVQQLVQTGRDAAMNPDCKHFDMGLMTLALSHATTPYGPRED